MKKKEVVYITNKIDLDYVKDYKYIYKIEDIKIGNIEGEVFFDENGNKYQSIKHPMFNLSEEEKGYYKTSAFDELDINERVQAMKDYSEKLLLAGSFDPYTDRVDIYELDINKLTDKYFNKDLIAETEEHYCAITIKGFLEIVESNDIDAIRELIELIKEHRYDGEDIEVFIGDDEKDNMDFIDMPMKTFLSYVNIDNMNSTREFAGLIKENYSEGNNLIVSLEDEEENKTKKRVIAKKKTGK